MASHGVISNDYLRNMTITQPRLISLAKKAHLALRRMVSMNYVDATANSILRALDTVCYSNSGMRHHEPSPTTPDYQDTTE